MTAEEASSDDDEESSNVDRLTMLPHREAWNEYGGQDGECQHDPLAHYERL
jgi:hypothetical protein